jgi:exodeoxyribonuclease V gamma subunit
VLHLHRAERADGLVAALGDLLVEPLPDPFAPEVIAVPTRGMERWLTQKLSASLGARPERFDGVCANVDFPPPGRLVGEAVAAASGIDPEDDRWLPERAVWPLLEVVDACLDEPWLLPLATYLGGPVRRTRRLSTVRGLARLFARYALQRPDMLLAWANGEDAGWQAELWRRLRGRIGQPSPAERLDPACARLRDDPGSVQLPERLSLFGLTRLPASHLQVLRALAAGRDVHLFLLHPSPALWDAVAGHGAPAIRRDDDTTAELAVNRLLASWGHDAREMQLVVMGDCVDHHHPVTFGADTLLVRLQADVRANRPARERPLLDPGDRSVQVHACHGRARQVEVLRDAILHELQEDTTLEPRDVIVMCPDVETFAPLIHATFGAGESFIEDDAAVRAAPDLRVRLADRSLRQTNPLLGVVAALIDLAEQRLTASELLDLADREPMRRRFRFDDDDVSRLQDWIADSGIRWGLDAAHRDPFKLGDVKAGTWRVGLDRVLAGVAMTEDDQRLFEGVLPLDDVESGAIDLAGRFAELIDRLQTALDALATEQPIDTWAAAIANAADALTATSARDAWQRLELQRLLDDVVTDAAANATPIALPELRALVADRLRGRPTRANFRTGHLTICTLVPMRSVPHRVVCLLGLDDEAFPRKGARDGDDLILDDPHVGDRDGRLEDRQMLLDALLAATDRLIVTYTGNDERTNAVRPPAVPVGELLDVIDATVRTEVGRARERIVVRHPLQPFDPENFRRGALVRDRHWGFDAVTLGGAEALAGPRLAPAPFLPDPLPPTVAGVIEIEDLVRFAQHPVRAFLRQRLGISVRDFADEVEDDLPVELDGLAKWEIGQRLVDAMLAGTDGRTATLAEIARGSLPPGILGRPVVEEVFPVSDEIVAAAQAIDASPPDSIDVRLALPDGRLLSGTVPGVSGDVLRAVTYSKLGARQRLAAWVRLLALTLARPERRFSAATIGRATGDACVAIARIPPLGRDEALDHLAVLLDLYDRGMREPLPLYCATAAAYAQAAADGRDPIAAARGEWTDARYDKEDKEVEHQLVLGGVRSLDDLLTEPPQAGEDWGITEPTRLGRLAVRLWSGLLAHEELVSR